MARDIAQNSCNYLPCYLPDSSLCCYDCLLWDTADIAYSFLPVLRCY